MLLPAQANSYAHQFLQARADAASVENMGLAVADAYAVAKRIEVIRSAKGETAIGRKLGFTNRKLWSKSSHKEVITAPIWSTLFDSTVRFLDQTHTQQSLTGILRPRIEPEVVFKLARTPAPDANLEELSNAIEWMAHGIEIVASPFADWQFEAADAIAAFGLHGSLLIGEPRHLSDSKKPHLAHILSQASTSLSCDGQLLAAGYGSNVLDSPLHALWHLHQMLCHQTEFAHLQAGEIISTGAWIKARPVQPGQTWSTAFSGINLPGLSVSFV